MVRKPRVLTVLGLAALPLSALAVTVVAAPAAGAQENCGCVAAQLTSGSPPAEAAVGQPFSFTFSATGSPVLSWQLQVTQGALPAGLTFDPAAATLSGTPSAPGAAAYSVTVTSTCKPVDDDPPNDVNDNDSDDQPVVTTSTASYVLLVLAAPSTPTGGSPGASTTTTSTTTTTTSPTSGNGTSGANGQGATPSPVVAAAGGSSALPIRGASVALFVKFNKVMANKSHLLKFQAAFAPRSPFSSARLHIARWRWNPAEHKYVHVGDFTTTLHSVVSLAPGNAIKVRAWLSDGQYSEVLVLKA